MDSERYDRMKDLFVQASELPPAQRAVFLDAQCAGDEQLRREVEDLLRHHDEPTSTITTGSPTSHPGSGLPSSSSASHPSQRHVGYGSAGARQRKPEPMPKQIGNYRVIREIGRGGMGLVYLGVREEGRFQKRAAIKVIKKGMDTEDVLRRFELERQLLSALNHNNIARLFDGGMTEDGRPYFALEYVEGLPIDVYCDRNKLTIDERLQLFKQVCSAVAYAHRNLVVHRDIKPANIIITEDGTAKLLDFGIAKLLNPELSLVANDPTAPEMRVMTPEYASPEQVRGEKITTASDVYSLGVLLYELLTGHRPYRIKERIRSEIERIICEQEPERPSTAISKIEELPDRTISSAAVGAPSTRTVTPQSVSATRSAKPEALRRRLAGDIDNIILMAMRKEPIRRYTSVERMSEDIDRHMNNLPVSARPASVVYRSTKFVRRNKAGVAIAALIALSVSAWAGVMLTAQAAAANAAKASEAIAWAEAEEARAAEAEAATDAALSRADAERARAMRRQMMLRSLANDFLFTFHDAIVRLEGSTGARQLLVATALEQLREIEQDPDTAGDRELKMELAAGYQRWGDVQGGTRSGSLGDTEAAAESYARAVEIFSALVEQDPADLTPYPGLMASYERMGDVYWRMGLPEESAHYYELRVELARDLFARQPNDLNVRRRLARAIQDAGAISVLAGDHQDALEMYEEAYDHFLVLQEQLPENAIVARDVAVIKMRLADRNRAVCNYEEAVRYAIESVDIRRRQWEDDPTSAMFRRDLGIALQYVGSLYLRTGDIDSARVVLQEAHEHFEHLAEVDMLDSRGLRDRASVYGELGDLFVANEDLDGALANYRAFNGFIAALAATDDHDAIAHAFLSKSHERLGQVLGYRDQLPEAIRHYRQAIEVSTLLLERAPSDVRRMEDVARQQAALGGLLIKRNMHGEALRLLDESAEMFEKLVALTPESCEYHEGLAQALGHLSALAAMQGDSSRSISYVQKGFDLTGQRLPVLLAALAAGHRLLGEDAEAEAILREALTQLEEKGHLTYDEGLLRETILAELRG